MDAENSSDALGTRSVGIQGISKVMKGEDENAKKMRYDRVMFEMWLENNRSVFIIVGIILLLLGLFMLVIKRSNAFNFALNQFNK